MPRGLPLQTPARQGLAAGALLNDSARRARFFDGCEINKEVGLSHQSHKALFRVPPHSTHQHSAVNPAEIKTPALPAARRRGFSRTQVLIAALAVVALVLCYQAFQKKYNRQLHLAVVNELEKLFPDASIYVGYVAKHPSGNLIITDICLADRDAHPKRPIFSAQRAVLGGKLDITDYVQGQMRLQRIDLHGAQLSIWPTQTGWSIDSLKMAPQKAKANTPKVTLKQASVQLYKDASPNSSAVTLHDIGGVIRETIPKSTTTTPLLVADLNGSGSGRIERFQLQAQLEPKSSIWRVTGTTKGLHLGPHLYNDLPDAFSQHLKQAEGLECKANAGFDIYRSLDQTVSFKVRGSLTDGRLQDPRLPYELEHLSGDFTCRNSRLQLRNLVASSNRARLELNVDMDGLQLSSPMRIDANIQDLNLDQRLYQSLPIKLKEQWDRLQVSGQVSGHLWLEFDGARWRPTMSVNCQNVSIKPWLFPYPIDNIRGQVEFRNSPDSIRATDLVGTVEGQPASGSIAVTKAAEGEWIGFLKCKTNGQIAIDELLLSALTERGKPTNGAETFVRSLSPSGTLELKNAEFWREKPNTVWQKRIDANIYNGSINYTNFRYPIYDIRGRLYCEDDLWQLDRFEGSNDSGRILCSGNWQSIRSGIVPFKLEFNALDVPIEEELKRALPQQAQFVWEELQPLGSIDNVSITLERKPLASEVSTRVWIREESSSNSTTGRSLRMRPRAFPYWLTDVDCEIDYTPELVRIQRASGINGASRISMRGVCLPTASGTWKANVEWLPQTRLWVETELLKALPKSIRDSLVKTDFSGPISVLGQSSIEFGKTREDPVDTTWNCEVAVEDGKLGDGKQVGSLRGTLAMQGASQGSNVYSRGTINMDALTLLGIPVTQLRGPFALVGTDLYFGSRVYDVFPAESADAVEHMTADALAGSLRVTGNANLADNQGKFYVSAQLQDADLKYLLQDVGVSSPTTEATVDATLEFNGVPWNPQTYDGYGNIHLSEAQLYELPFMMRLMNVASVNPTHDSAFQTADIDFEIDGNRIPIVVSCEGDILWLRGEGETNLRRDIRLDLYSYVGRGSLAKMAGSLLPDSRQATFMLVEIDGTLDNPTMQRKAFPQIEATFQQIFPEIAARRENNPVLPWRK